MLTPIRCPFSKAERKAAVIVPPERVLIINDLNWYFDRKKGDLFLQVAKFNQISIEEVELLNEDSRQALLVGFFEHCVQDISKRNNIPVPAVWQVAQEIHLIQQ